MIIGSELLFISLSVRNFRLALVYLVALEDEADIAYARG